MRVLVVASFNKGWFAPFLREQAKALEGEDCELLFWGLQGKGIRGYLDGSIHLHSPSVNHWTEKHCLLMEFLEHCAHCE